MSGGTKNTEIGALAPKIINCACLTADEVTQAGLKPEI